MLALSYKLYLVKKEPYFSALLFSVPIAIGGLFMGNSLTGVFIGSSILFALTFFGFWLLNKVPNGRAHYAVVAVMAVIMMFATYH